MSVNTPTASASRATSERKLRCFGGALAKASVPAQLGSQTSSLAKAHTAAAKV